MADLKSLAEQLVNLTVQQVNELATILKDEYNIEPAAAPVAVAAAGGAGDAGGGEEAAAKTEFDIMLTEGGQQKLKVVKLVKDLTGLGLKDAKELVDNAPKAIKQGVPKDEAESMKKSLEEIGAVVELK